VTEDGFEAECFTIGELSRRLGVNAETIRYYERIRLLPRPSRTSGGRRVYRNDSLRTLAFIKRSRELGFRLADIRALLDLRAAQGCCVDVKAIAGRHLETVRTRLQELAAMEQFLTAAIARCPGDSSVECPVLQTLDAADPKEQRPLA
jgi:MerR family mercuric resistance operon transcriptional regulator